MGKTIRTNNPITNKYEEKEKYPQDKRKIQDVNENRDRFQETHKKHYYIQRIWPNDSENKSHKGRKI